MKTSTRALRERLSATLARAARGAEVIVTRRGKPYVKLISAGPESGLATTAEKRRYPLRGSVLFIADDFDAPMEDLWRAMSGDPA